MCAANTGFEGSVGISIALTIVLPQNTVVDRLC